MSTYGIAGSSPLADFTADIEDLIEALLDNGTNWTETAPARADIKFGNEWFDDSKTYQIHVVPSDEDGRSISNPGNYKEYEKLVFVHIFAKKVTDKRPAAMGKMIRQAKKILTQKRNDSSLQGARIAEPIQFRTADTDVWHSYAVLHVHYVMVDTS